MTAQAGGAAVAPIVSREHHVSELGEARGHVLVAGAVIGEAVDDQQAGAGLLLGQVPVGVQLEAVEGGEFFRVGGSVHEDLPATAGHLTMGTPKLDRAVIAMRRAKGARAPSGFAVTMAAEPLAVAAAWHHR